MYDPLDRHGSMMTVYTYPDGAIKSCEKKVTKLKQKIDELEKENQKLKKVNEFLLDGVIYEPSDKK